MKLLILPQQILDKSEARVIGKIVVTFGMVY